MVLGREAGVCEIAVNTPPLAQATVIEQFQLVSDDEWYNATAQALLEHDEASHAAIAILEGVYLLETNMEVEDIFQRM